LSFRTMYIRTMGTLPILVYNLVTMENTPTPEVSKVERDPGLLILLLIPVFGIAYYWTLVDNPTIQQPELLIAFTSLMVIHVLLYGLVGFVFHKPRLITWHIILQGVLAFTICWMGNRLPLIFALYMAILGEALGMLGITRRALLAFIFYFLLAFINIQHLMDPVMAGKELSGLAPLFLFSILFVILYQRQYNARQQAVSLTADLENANRQLAEYSARVEELTLTAERQRMARELHDTLSQGLAGLVLQLEAIKAHLEAGRGERAKEIITQSLARARSTLASSRAAIDDLRAIPTSLIEAMRARTERFSHATGIPCELNIALRDIEPPLNINEHLLSVLNEALANITRHAQADQVRINLETVNDRLELVIRDDGIGFDPGIVIGTGHYGLLGMRERARLVGGNLEIESGNGQGTCIRFVVPNNEGVLNECIPSES
jgi:NarL family two-component system sensor histidine kinase YdfH